MANTHKFKVKNGLTSPNIEFKDSNTGAAITATMTDSTDTLSFEGDAGQLFSITDNLTGTLFTVSDISGIPSLEINDQGIVKLAEFNGKVLISTTDSGSSDSDVLNVGGTVKAALFSGSGFSLTSLNANNIAFGTVDSARLPAGTFGGGGVGGTFSSHTSTATLAAFTTALANTSGGAFTLNLPASPSVNDEIIILDATGSFGTNNLTIGRNGQNIQGVAQDLVADISGVAIRLHYTSSGWRVFTIVGTNAGNVVTLTGIQTVTNKTLNNTILQNYDESVVNIGNTGSTHTFSTSNGTVQKATLNANCTFSFGSAGTNAGSSIVLSLTQSGSFTATFTGVKFPGGTAPTITTGANKIDVLSFYCDGTNWYGNAVQDMS